MHLTEHKGMLNLITSAHDMQASLSLERAGTFVCLYSANIALQEAHLLQGITLIWTLLKNGHELLGGDPIARRCIICCPTSLVSNWESECKKWLQVPLTA